MIWPIQATQVAHYAAVMIGLVVVLWFCGYLRGRTTALVAAASMAVLILTHTRTALAALIAGILIAGMSLIVAEARVRKLFATVGAVAAVTVMTLSAVIATWLERGQGDAGPGKPHRPHRRSGVPSSLLLVTSSRRSSASACRTFPSMVSPSTATGSLPTRSRDFSGWSSAR